jgi:ABC-2 type transport system ATP-binding protein
MLCGLLTPDAGTGICLGFDLIKDSDAIKRRVGYMTQKFSLYDDLTVSENLRFVADVYQMDNVNARIETLLHEMDLDQRRHQLAGTLSGGWKQRLALSACQLHEPELLLLDEPTAGVDPGARRQFWQHIHRLAASGVTILVSTHYMDEAERCHRLAYIASGTMLAQGTPTELVAQHGQPTWSIHGEHSNHTMQQLEAIRDVTQVTAFGHQLHVSAHNSDVESQLEAFCNQRQLQLKRSEPLLEDVFIRLQKSAEDR